MEKKNKKINKSQWPTIEEIPSNAPSDDQLQEAPGIFRMIIQKPIKPKKTLQAKIKLLHWNKIILFRWGYLYVWIKKSLKSRNEER